MNEINLEFQNSITKIHKQIESAREKLAFEVETLHRTSIEKLHGNRVLNSCERIQQFNKELTFLIVELTILQNKPKIN